MANIIRGLLTRFIPLALAALPAFAASAETDFTSKTYLKFFQDARDSSFAPLYEYVDMESRPGAGGLSLHLSGWAGHDFREVAAGDDKTRKELTYAYARYAPYADRRLLITAGRQYVFEGVASEQFDGLSARWELTPATGFSVFGGGPVETDFDGRRSDTLYGGRAFQRIGHKAELGLSAVAEGNGGRRFRQEGGVDLWLLPVRWAEVKGQSSYNNLTEGWREHAYNLRLGPAARFTFTGAFARTNYQDAFSARTLSAFSPDFLGKDEQLTKRGGSVEWRVSDSVSGVVNYTDYRYEIAGDAARYGGRLSLSNNGVTTGLSLHRMAGAIEQLQYLETRLYAAADVEDWRFSLDAINHHYKSSIGGVDSAYGLNGAVRYALSESLTAAASVDYGRTPDFLRNTTALFNLVYSFRSGR